MTDLLLFAVFPYVAMSLFVFVGITRYRRSPFTVSSLSAQFLECRQHFWGSVPFHYGILAVLAGHLAGLLVPDGVLLWNRHPLRLYLLELTGFSFALLALFGIINVLVRRATDARSRIVTSRTDWVLFLLLLVQVATGVFTAVFHGWGSSWFAASATPYLVSLVTFSPEVSYIAPMPWTVKTHVAGAFLFVAIVPYTRLMHFLVAPFHYLWRKPQVVRWHGARRSE